MGSEGLFHYSDIPRQYTQAVLCKQGAVFEPRVCFNLDAKSRNFTVQKNCMGTKSLNHII